MSCLLRHGSAIFERIIIKVKKKIKKVNGAHVFYYYCSDSPYERPWWREIWNKPKNTRIIYLNFAKEPFKRVQLKSKTIYVYLRQKTDFNKLVWRLNKSWHSSARLIAISWVWGLIVFTSSRFLQFNEQVQEIPL